MADPGRRNGIVQDVVPCRKQGTSRRPLHRYRRDRTRACGTGRTQARTVFNYPTLAECYKVAAFHAANKIGYLPESERIEN